VAAAVELTLVMQDKAVLVVVVLEHLMVLEMVDLLFQILVVEVEALGTALHQQHLVEMVAQA
jgi:hypothetical protein